MTSSRWIRRTLHDIAAEGMFQCQRSQECFTGLRPSHRELTRMPVWILGMPEVHFQGRVLEGASVGPDFPCPNLRRTCQVPLTLRSTKALRIEQSSKGSQAEWPMTRACETKNIPEASSQISTQSLSSSSAVTGCRRNSYSSQCEELPCQMHWRLTLWSMSAYTETQGVT